MIEDIVWHWTMIKIGHHSLNYSDISLREALPLCLLTDALHDILPEKGQEFYLFHCYVSWFSCCPFRKGKPPGVM